MTKLSNEAILGLYGDDTRVDFDEFRAFFDNDDEESEAGEAEADVVEATDGTRAEITAEIGELSDTYEVDVVEFASAVMEKEALVKALKSNPLFADLGMNTLQKLFEEAELRTVPNRGEIISPDGKEKGMFIPIGKVSVEVIANGGNSVKKMEMDSGNSYVGEYAMAGIKPTATIVNTSDDGQFIYVSHELFASLHPRSRQQILESLLKNSPLVKYDEKDPDDVSPDAIGIISYSPERPDVPVVLSQLTLKEHPQDAFKPHYVESYGQDAEITPRGKGYLGIIIEGAVSVSKIEGDSTIKKAHIERSNTIFEANAVGVAPSDSIKLASESNETKILWINLSPDDDNYERLLAAAIDGQADKLGASNVRISEIQSLSRAR